MIQINLVCKECGNKLRSFMLENTINTGLILQVPVCDRCRERATDVAYNEGRDAGLEGRD
jgi:C4-type Zn-finger protein